MFGAKLDRQAAGAPIAAATINAAVDVAERVSGMAATPPMEMQHGPGGDHVRLCEVTSLDARLTGGGAGGAYSWRGVYADVDHPGAWLDFDSDMAGTVSDDPAYEGNGNAGLGAGTRVHLRRDRTSNQLIFWYGACS